MCHFCYSLAFKKILWTRSLFINCSFNRIVTYDNINKVDYYTISSHAVMHYCGAEVDFLPLERWEQEYRYHQRLLRIPLFTLFRKWKAFRVWRANVRSKNISKCRRSLQENLFILNEVCPKLCVYVFELIRNSVFQMFSVISVFQSLRPALIDIKEMCYHISDMPLCRLEKNHTYTLKEFQSAQSKQLEEVREFNPVFVYV